MTIDISAFDANKNFVLGWFATKGGKDIKRTISMMAQATNVPCIVIAYWLGELTDWHPDTVAAIVRLKGFYGYTTIKNAPIGAPHTEG